MNHLGETAVTFRFSDKFLAAVDSAKEWEAARFSDAAAIAAVAEDLRRVVRRGSWFPTDEEAEAESKLLVDELLRGCSPGSGWVSTMECLPAHGDRVLCHAPHPRGGEPFIDVLSYMEHHAPFPWWRREGDGWSVVADPVAHWMPLGSLAEPRVADAYHRVEWRDKRTGETGHGAWMPAGPQNQVMVRDLNAASPAVHHWLGCQSFDGDPPQGTEREAAPLLSPAHCPAVDVPLQRLAALSDDELDRRVARALSLPPLRYATSFGDAYDMEEALPEAERQGYAQALATVADGGAWHLLRATPRERCIALLLALGEG
jgi:hypothetical protein